MTNSHQRFVGFLRRTILAASLVSMAAGCGKKDKSEAPAPVSVEADNEAAGAAGEAGGESGTDDGEPGAVDPGAENSAAMDDEADEPAGAEVPADEEGEADTAEVEGRNGSEAQQAPPPAIPQEAVPGPPGNIRALDPAAISRLRAGMGLAPLEAPPLDRLVRRADIRELTRFTGALTETALPGVTPGPDYNATRFAADDGLGLTVQVWRYSAARQVDPAYEALRTSVWSSRAVRDIADSAFASDFESIRTVAFAHRASRSVVSLSCNAEICDFAQLRSLARRVSERL